MFCPNCESGVNEDFRDEILIPVIETTKDGSDSGELFLRVIKLTALFEMVSGKNDSSPSNSADRIIYPKEKHNIKYGTK